MIRALIKEGTSLRQAYRLIIPGAVLHNLIPSEDVPADYNTEKDVQPDDALNQPTSPAVTTDFILSS